MLISSCIYFGTTPTPQNPVPPKCLLQKPFPPNLLTVPSCKKCNADFSLDEQYFLVLLSQIGTTNTLTVKVEHDGIVDRALKRSPALDGRVFQSLETDEEGRIVIRPEL